MTPNFVSDQLVRLSALLVMRAGSRPQALFPARSVVLENTNLEPTLALIAPLENSPSQVRVRVYYRLSVEYTRLGQTGPDRARHLHQLCCWFLRRWRYTRKLLFNSMVIQNLPVCWRHIKTNDDTKFCL